jgi:hypothetical protein
MKPYKILVEKLSDGSLASFMPLRFFLFWQENGSKGLISTL